MKQVCNNFMSAMPIKQINGNKYLSILLLKIWIKISITEEANSRQ